MAGSNVEEFVIRLQEVVSGPANTAANAIEELEARIKSQGQAIGQYEQQLAAAAAKLQAMTKQGQEGSVNVAAFRKQQQAVADLQQKVDDATASYERLEAARPLAGQAAEFQKARGAITAAADALAELEAQMDLATASSAKADVDQLTAAINRQRQAVLDAQKAYVQMGGSAQDAVAAGGGAGRALGVSASQAAGGTNELVDALAGVEGEIGGTVSRGQQLARVFQAMGAAAPAIAFVALAAAIAIVTVAIVAATVAATKWAITMADAARTQALNLASLAANHKALANIADIMPRVQAETGLASDQLNQLAERLAKAKVPANRMEDALKAMATATAGGASSEFLKKLEDGLKRTGKVPAELAEQMAKFEAIAKQKMLSLDSQGERLKQNVSGLFKDIKIDGFLSALNEVVKLFDSSTASGQALKFILETMFQPLIDAATRAIPRIVRGFLKLEIAVLKTYIAIQKLKEVLPKGDTGTGGMRVQVDTFNAMAAAAKGAHAGVSGVKSSYNAMLAVVDAGNAKLSGISLGDIGANMMGSLADSITSGGSAVVSAISNVVDGAIAKAEAILEIASPSKRLRRMGRYAMQGLGLGADDEAVAVEKSAEKAAGGLVSGTAKGSKGSAGRGGGPSIEFNNCTFGDGVDESSMRSWMTKIWHQLSLEEPEPEPTG